MPVFGIRGDWSPSFGRLVGFCEVNFVLIRFLKTNTGRCSGWNCQKRWVRWKYVTSVWRGKRRKWSTYDQIKKAHIHLRPLAHRGNGHLVHSKHSRCLQACSLRSSSNDVLVPCGWRQRDHMAKSIGAISSISKPKGVDWETFARMKSASNRFGEASRLGSVPTIPSENINRMASLNRLETQRLHRMSQRIRWIGFGSVLAAFFIS